MGTNQTRQSIENTISTLMDEARASGTDHSMVFSLDGSSSTTTEVSPPIRTRDESSSGNNSSPPVNIIYISDETEFESDSDPSIHSTASTREETSHAPVSSSSGGHDTAVIGGHDAAVLGASQVTPGTCSAAGPPPDSVEQRLQPVLWCVICLDLPPAACYQCRNGHLICGTCQNRLDADAFMEGSHRTVTCPACRCVMSEDIRNRAVEKAVSEMPAPCPHCSVEMPRYQLPHHQTDTCPRRPSPCPFAVIGCPWTGPLCDVMDHECSCTYPDTSGDEVLEFLEGNSRDNAREKEPIFDLMSLGDIRWLDLRLKWYYDPTLYYKSDVFTVFDLQFLLKAKVKSDRTNGRSLAYQMICDSRLTSPVKLKFVVLKSPSNFNDIDIKPKIKVFTFTPTTPCTYFFNLHLTPAQCNEFLCQDFINFRLLITTPIRK